MILFWLHGVTSDTRQFEIYLSNNSVLFDERVSIITEKKIR